MEMCNDGFKTELQDSPKEPNETDKFNEDASYWPFEEYQ